MNAFDLAMKEFLAAGGKVQSIERNVSGGGGGGYTAWGSKKKKAPVESSDSEDSLVIPEASADDVIESDDE